MGMFKSQKLANSKKQDAFPAIKARKDIVEIDVVSSYTCRLFDVAPLTLPSPQRGEGKFKFLQKIIIES